MSTPVPQQPLWTEAVRLSGAARDAAGEAAKLGVEVIQSLAAQEAASKNPQTRAMIRRTEEAHHQIIAWGMDGGFEDFLQNYSKEKDFYIARWEQVLARNSRADWQTIANEEPRNLIARALQDMESEPDNVELLVAAVAIAHYSQLFYYVDLLNTFLQYPTEYRRALDVASNLAQAVVMDLAGTAIPFLGTITTIINTVFDLAEPRIKKKIEELRQAAEVFDRVCDFGDQLTELSGYQDFTKENMRHADQIFKITHASFATNADWLSAVLGNAARA